MNDDDDDIQSSDLGQYRTDMWAKTSLVWRVWVGETEEDG